MAARPSTILHGCCYHSAAVALQEGLFTEQHEDALRSVAA